MGSGSTNLSCCRSFINSLIIDGFGFVMRIFLNFAFSFLSFIWSNNFYRKAIIERRKYKKEAAFKRKLSFCGLFHAFEILSAVRENSQNRINLQTFAPYPYAVSFISPLGKFMLLFLRRLQNPVCRIA